MKKHGPYGVYLEAVLQRLSAVLSKLNSSLNVKSFTPALNFLSQRGINITVLSCEKAYSKEKQKLTVKLRVATKDRVQETEEITYMIFFNNEGFFGVIDQYGKNLSTAHNRPLYEEQIIDLIIADLMPSLTRKILGVKPIHEG